MPWKPMQQLVALKEISTYYWSAENATAELDFLGATGRTNIPIKGINVPLYTIGAFV